MQGALGAKERRERAEFLERGKSSVSPWICDEPSYQLAPHELLGCPLGAMIVFFPLIE